MHVQQCCSGRRVLIESLRVSTEAKSLAVLALQVTLLGVSKMIDKCIRGRRQQSKLNPRADYACFEE